MSGKNQTGSRKSGRNKSTGDSNVHSHVDKGKHGEVSPIFTQPGTGLDAVPEYPTMGNTSEETLKNILSSLKTIIDDIQGMKKDISELKNDVSGIRASVTKIEETAETAKATSESNKQKLTELSADLKKMKGELSKTQMDNKLLKEKLVKIEAQDRRNNLVLDGCDEKDNENCSETVFNVLEKLVPNARASIKIERCHRMPSFKPKNPPGGASASRPRPIIFKLHSYSDRERIFKERNRLANSGLYLREDFPKEIVEKRRFLAPIARKARSEGSKARLSYDKLVIDSQVFTEDNVHALPESLQPAEVYTKRGPKYTAFFSKHSPLSNHHPSKFKLDGIEFSSQEQYFMYQKALHCNDRANALKILNTTDPGECKAIGKTVKIPDLKVWEEEREGVMYTGCIAKFEQNSDLKDFLLSTKDTKLIECNMYDSHWSIGLGLNDEKIFDESAWKGQNKLGGILSEIREELKILDSSNL